MTHHGGGSISSYLHVRLLVFSNILKLWTRLVLKKIMSAADWSRNESNWVPVKEWEGSLNVDWSGVAMAMRHRLSGSSIYEP